ncbi:hypothetical protein E4656_17760 [Natronospirillum operosum]|uniref:DUF4013 domain-containing protein n=1 Tax=Natronospirillum operosum TaxID=2759953 RepID=A0A4Z0W2Y3_9GAMM|nr:hypothetical protein [Natronospirillum operosum]TGG90782.1 hypothetical protein E4656_17760 [Natronospirillum operosum]
MKLKLPILEVVVAAFRLPVQMRESLLPAIQWPLILLVGLQVAGTFWGGPEAGEGAILMIVLFGITGLVVTAMVAVPAHQIFIRGALNEASGGLRWTSRETWYFLWSIGLPLIVLVLASLISMPLVVIANMTGVPVFASLAVLIGLIAGIAVYGRFSMVLPRIALGQAGGLRAAGQMAGEHYWRVGLISVLFPLIINLVPMFLQGALGPIGVPLAVLVGVYFVIVQIAALALVYRWLQEFAEPPEEDREDEGGNDDTAFLDDEQADERWLEDDQRGDQGPDDRRH